LKNRREDRDVSSDDNGWESDDERMSDDERTCVDKIHTIERTGDADVRAYDYKNMSGRNKELQLMSISKVLFVCQWLRGTYILFLFSQHLDGTSSPRDLANSKKRSTDKQE
jgi:hypothetical protein